MAMCSRSRCLLLTVMLAVRLSDPRPPCRSSRSCLTQGRRPRSRYRRARAARGQSLSRNRELPSAVTAMWTFSLPSLLTVMRASRASLQSRPPDTRPSNFSSAFPPGIARCRPRSSPCGLSLPSLLTVVGPPGRRSSRGRPITQLCPDTPTGSSTRSASPSEPAFDVLRVAVGGHGHV